MRTADLRLGNFIQDQFGDVIIVDGLDDMDVFSSNCGDIPIHAVDPIPLNEKWLLGFGFEYEIRNEYAISIGDYTLLLSIEKDHITVIYSYLWGRMIQKPLF